jgi:L-ascorbate metabolism protein UlaG (beta-lactamase superfamily)
MKVRWLGHASFLITSDNGTRIITDPYIAGSSGIKYGEINEAADVVTVSHDHFDHNNVDSVRGNPQVIKEPTEAKGIKFEGVATYHDASEGSERGNNTIFCMDIDGVKVCHLGDLGHPLSDQQVADIGKIDVLLIPVGGFFTIDAKVASEVSDRLHPNVIIPMHYKNEKLDFPIAGVDDFLEGKGNVRKMDSSEIELKAGALPTENEIVVLKPAF